MIKPFYKDALLNIVAVAVPIVVLQLIVFPLAAAELTADTYGLVTAVYAIMSLIPGHLGLALCNIRLIYNNKYQDLGYHGDFTNLLIKLVAICVIAVSIMLAIYRVTALGTIVLVLVTSVIWLIREYAIVKFRIEINYKQILISNFSMALGYALGYVLFYLIGFWQLIILMGQLFALIYTLIVTDIYKEPFSSSQLLQEVKADLTYYSGAIFLSRGISYSDRIILYPLFGGELVAVYYVSSLIGKMISMAFAPLNTVVLTYIAKSNSKPRAVFTKLLLLGIVACAVGVLLIMIIGKPILSILYPAFVDEAMVYLPYTSAAALVYALNSILNTYIERYYAMSWQLKVNVVIAILYVIVAYLSFMRFGLFGFCAGLLMVNVIRIVVTVGIYYFLDADSKSLKADSLTL